MNIQAMRAGFSVLFADMDFKTSGPLAEAFKAAGYQSIFFPTMDSALARARENPPHILVFNYVSGEQVGDKFLESFKKLSPETLVILLINGRNLLVTLQKISDQRIFDYASLPLISPLELLVKVDRAASELYFIYENEQIRQKKGTQPVNHFEKAPAVLDTGSTDMYKSFKDMRGIKTQDELTKSYLQNLSHHFGDVPSLYLKFQSTQLSFGIQQSMWLPEEEMRNVGFTIDSLSSEILVKLFKNPAEFPRLKEMVQKVFKIDKFEARAHAVDNIPLGISVLLKDLSQENDKHWMAALHEFYSATYARNESLKESHSLRTRDANTGLLNRVAFGDEMINEIARARRLKHPVSLAIMKLDSFAELTKLYGEKNIQFLVKSIAKSMKKNFRTFDILGRTENDEFAFLLPHTTATEAALKSERMRRAVEVSQFPFLGDSNRRITVSVGISEYPTLCADADALRKTCDDVLFQVESGGGNKVAMWRAHKDFAPDFAPINLKVAK